MFYQLTLDIPCISQRAVMCFLASSGLMAAWMIDFSIEHTLMDVAVHPFEHMEKHYNLHRCSFRQHKHNQIFMRYKKHGEIYWTQNMMQGMKLSASLAFLVSGLPGGLVADMYGVRHVFGVCVLLASVSSLLLPFLLHLSPYTVIAATVIQGLAQGIMRPCTSVVVAHWAPDCEITIFVAIIESGSMIAWLGILFFQENVRMWQGWEGWLYISGMVGTVWCLLWYILYYDTPTEHPHISQAELEYIQAHTPGISHLGQQKGKTFKPVPWRQIFLSLPFQSLLVLFTGTWWIYSFIRVQMPPYFVQALNVLDVYSPPGLTQTGMGVCLFSLSTICHGVICDLLIKYGLTSRTANRRFFLLFSNYVVVILFLMVPNMTCNTLTVVGTFFLMIYIIGMANAAMSANSTELAPAFAGLLRGIISSGGALSNVLCQQMVKVMVKDFTDPAAWSGFFYLSAAILAVFSSPYLCFGSGNIQPWNDFPVTRKGTELKPSLAESPAGVEIKPSNTLLPSSSTNIQERPYESKT